MRVSPNPTLHLDVLRSELGAEDVLDLGEIWGRYGGDMGETYGRCRGDVGT